MVNICGEVEGINTAGLSGLGLAISADSIKQKWLGFWDVKNIDGKWRLWDPEIKEIENPPYIWFYE